MRRFSMVRGPIRVAVAALVVLLVGLAPAVTAAGRPGSGSGEAARTSAAVTVTRVKMVNFAFRPRSITISKGTKVRWAVTEGTHSTTSNTGLWDSGVLSAGGSFARVFRRAGTFKYHCSVHPTTMKGVITVQ
jgi:plastocyanin